MFWCLNLRNILKAYFSTKSYEMLYVCKKEGYGRWTCLNRHSLKFSEQSVNDLNQELLDQIISNANKYNYNIITMWIIFITLDIGDTFWYLQLTYLVLVMDAWYYRDFSWHQKGINKAQTLLKSNTLLPSIMSKLCVGSCIKFNETITTISSLPLPHPSSLCEPWQKRGSK